MQVFAQHTADLVGISRYKSPVWATDSFADHFGIVGVIFWPLTYWLVTTSVWRIDVGRWEESIQFAYAGMTSL